MNDERRGASAQSTDTPAAPPTSTVPILIVDDDAAKRVALKSVLVPLGYLIVEADSGLAALRCLMARDFAVILLDVRMPHMDGFETAALIRQRRQSEMTPIIFITAYGRDEIVNSDRYVEGAVDFMFAPVSPHELRAKVSVFANLFLKAEVLATRARDVQSSVDQLRLLTDAAPIGIFQTDSENRYVYTNPRWSEITAIPAQEAAGRAWETIIGSEQRAMAELAVGTLDRAELCHRFELQLPGAAARIVLVTSKVIPDGCGGVAGWVGTLADITAEVGAEAAMSTARDEATEASRLKSDFLANMSHEIRTPMNGVIGMTDLLLETALDTRQRDYAQTVRNSGEALLTIINDILDFSKIESGTFDLAVVEFSLRTIVDDVVDLLAGPAQTKGLELIAIVANSVPAVVSGDPGRVRQVLTNLIGNAIKFTQVGEIVVRVAADDATGAGTVIRFDVADTGDGIAPEKLDLIFQPFIQADTSTSRKYGGTGLGLAISGQLVALMGGDCGVSSEPGEGSNFWFTIALHADAGQEADELLTADADLTGMSALIVDDSVTQRSVLSEYLTDWGMRVTTADCGESALRSLRAAVAEGRPFDVALLDRSLPATDGLRLEHAILADADLAVRIVLVTGLSQERDADDGAQSGICASLSKPVHRDDLRTCLRVALGLQAADASPRETTAERPSSGDGQEVGRLLLAEDNLINQEVALAMLAGTGYRIDTVLNGAEAVQAAADQSYDAILMDCHMPELNGYEATAAIRAQEGPDRHTPIIAMTAGARREDRERCLAGGMDSYLAKPVSKDALLALVARSVGSAKTGPTAPSRGAPRAGDGAQVLNEAVIAELEELGGDVLPSLLALYFEQAANHVSELTGAVDRGDAPVVAEIAHKLKGGSVSLGAAHVSRLASDLEATARGGDLTDADDLLGKLRNGLGKTTAAFASRVAEPDNDANR
jgi:two-component system, sensor histidine kinase and response regulator